MDFPYHSLSALPLSGHADLMKSDDEASPALGLDSSAIEVMTDLSKVQPVTIGQDESLDEAHALMVRRAIRLLFVVDEAGRLSGLVTATDVLGERPLQCLREQGKKRTDLLVSDVMTPRHQVDALSLREVHAAKVGHMLATMQQLGRQHALVVEGDVVCGLFSTSQIARRLGISLHFIPASRTISEMCHFMQMGG
ncbi:CBS domain-containing protein [Crenobacter sp. SG2303]|uniref:CBS domain-containing protein n=1 Tax=Crenobacter oryzisoli TaxID=3056844 RepID=A0ABT7XS95_9NEIS|nr:MULTISPECIES: CBS domain-containing protein [unclassified Crenobacter]MDN0076668.1 CBS domain-containing protein [Crenobacter sp. SG2303]MDN0083939.1 CBS domain-containing protein [Crenobacter sp. SG2305]